MIWLYGLLGFILCFAFCVLVGKIIHFGAQDEYEYMLGDEDPDEGDRS
jgi:hypothetical protein